MNIIERKRLVDNLEEIAQYYCSYKAKSGQLCDCKFKPIDGKLQYMSETYCGCPEIKVARALIMALTGFEYERLVDRIHNGKGPLDDLTELVEKAENDGRCSILLPAKTGLGDERCIKGHNHEGKCER